LQTQKTAISILSSNLLLIATEIAIRYSATLPIFGIGTIIPGFLFQFSKDYFHKVDYNEIYEITACYNPRMDDRSLQDTVLGSRYRLIHQVGKGGMAYVYKAYDQMLERPVAIKLLRQDFSSEPGFRDRFRQEARSAANLSHPNIVTVHDFGLDSAGVYIVMEYIAGTDLKTRIAELTRYPVQDGIKLMVQACSGLGYAHRAGIVHCDIKPQNLLVTSDQRLKITDFGIARALSTLEVESDPDVIWGSPQYFAPEQALGALPTPSRMCIRLVW